MPASPRLVCHASASNERALRPATMSAGPSIPRVAISCPRDVVAFLPWVYRVGEQKTDSMCLLYCIAIDGEVPHRHVVHHPLAQRGDLAGGSNRKFNGAPVPPWRSPQ